MRLTKPHLDVVGVPAALGEIDVVDGGDAEPLASQVAQDGVPCSSRLETSFSHLGPSIYDVRKILGFFDLLPPCPHLGLIYSTKFTQPPLLHLLLG